MPEGGVGNSQARIEGREAGPGEDEGRAPSRERERNSSRMVRDRLGGRLGAPDSTQTLWGVLDSILKARR